MESSRIINCLQSMNPLERTQAVKKAMIHALDDKEFSNSLLYGVTEQVARETGMYFDLTGYSE